MAVGMGNRRFRPGLWPSVVTLLLVVLTSSLGNWQLERAEEKKALFASYEASGVTDGFVPVDLLKENSPPFTPVTAFGHFDNAHQILLDAMLNEGHAGYQVLTPLLRDGKTAVLVNRGWIPATLDRAELPVVEVTGTQRRVNGFKGRLPEPGMRLGEAPKAPSAWPRVALYPTRAELENMLGYPVLDTVLLMNESESDGYLRTWRPQLLSPDKHLGYAAQWFAIALALIVIYVVVNLRRPEDINDDR
ncbi:MAG: SURF1 family protein [Chromatiales bacterium]|nr:SURF1 family protein [Chromatiales bacterium]